MGYCCDGEIGESQKYGLLVLVTNWPPNNLKHVPAIKTSRQVGEYGTNVRFFILRRNTTNFHVKL